MFSNLGEFRVQGLWFIWPQMLWKPLPSYLALNKEWVECFMHNHRRSFFAASQVYTPTRYYPKDYPYISTIQGLLTTAISWGLWGAVRVWWGGELTNWGGPKSSVPLFATKQSRKAGALLGLMLKTRKGPFTNIGPSQAL